MGNRTYSPEFKLQVVLEALQSDGTDAEVGIGRDGALWRAAITGGSKYSRKDRGSGSVGHRVRVGEGGDPDLLERT